MHKIGEKQFKLVSFCREHGSIVLSDLSMASLINLISNILKLLSSIGTLSTIGALTLYYGVLWNPASHVGNLSPEEISQFNYLFA